MVFSADDMYETEVLTDDNRWISVAVMTVNDDWI